MNALMFHVRMKGNVLMVSIPSRACANLDMKVNMHNIVYTLLMHIDEGQKEMTCNEYYRGHL